MSELNVYHHELRPNEYAEFYLKYEADKVIAELEESHKKEVGQLLMEIAELKKERNWLAKDRSQAYDDLEKRAQLNIKQEESNRHHKYKRCLAMAERCKYRMYYLAAVVEQEASKIIPLKAQIQWYQKRENRMDYWKNRWLELAEKFKDKEVK